MISRRELLKGIVLTATGLLVPAQVVKVFYSIPKVVVPKNLGEATYYWWGNTPETSIFRRKEISLDQIRALFSLCETEPKTHPWPEVWRKI